MPNIFEPYRSFRLGIVCIPGANEPQWRLTFHLRTLNKNISKQWLNLPEVKLGRNSVYADIGVNLPDFRISRIVGTFILGYNDTETFLQMRAAMPKVDKEQKSLGHIEIEGNKLCLEKPPHTFRFIQNAQTKGAETHFSIVGANNEVKIPIFKAPFNISDQEIRTKFFSYWVISHDIRHPSGKQIDILLPLIESISEADIEIPPSLMQNTYGNLQRMLRCLNYQKQNTLNPLSLCINPRNDTLSIDGIKIARNTNQLLQEGMILQMA